MNICKVPITVNDEEKIGYGGTTYAMKNVLEKHGFKYNHMVNDEPMMLWLAPADTDTTELEDTFEEYGFPLEEFDGVDEEEEEGEEDE